MISILPTLVVLTPCIPDNVEAAMTALVTGVFVFSTDVGCKISGGILCNFFDVSNANLDLYWITLLAKCPMILVTMGLTAMIPTNRDIAAAAQRMDDEELMERSKRDDEFGSLLNDISSPKKLKADYTVDEAAAKKTDGEPVT